MSYYEFFTNSSGSSNNDNNKSEPRRKKLDTNNKFSSTYLQSLCHGYNERNKKVIFFLSHCYNHSKKFRYNEKEKRTLTPVVQRITFIKLTFSQKFD